MLRLTVLGWVAKNGLFIADQSRAGHSNFPKLSAPRGSGAIFVRSRMQTAFRGLALTPDCHFAFAPGRAVGSQDP